MRCQNCGAPMQEIQQICSACASLKQTVPNQSKESKAFQKTKAYFYYRKEFSDIAQKKRGKFNYAAFLCGGIHCLYYNCRRRVTFIYFPFWLMLMWFILWFQDKLTGYFSKSKVVVPDSFWQQSFILLIVLLLFKLVIALYDGFTFNRMLYHQTKGQLQEVVIFKIRTFFFVFLIFLCILVVGTRMSYFLKGVHVTEKLTIPQIELPRNEEIDSDFFIGNGAKIA